MPGKVVFISYSHDSDEHREKVLALAERLRQDGLDARLDQYVNGTPEQGWPRWMLDLLDEATFVLVVCTETYYRRFRGHEVLGRGRGGDWEGALITQEIYDTKSRTVKFVPVLLSVRQEHFIPEPLRGHTHYELTSEERYQDLYAFLLDQAGVKPRPLGDLKPVSKRSAQPLTFAPAPAHPTPAESSRSQQRRQEVPRLHPATSSGKQELDLPGPHTAHNEPSVTPSPRQTPRRSARSRFSCLIVALCVLVFVGIGYASFVYALYFQEKLKESKRSSASAPWYKFTGPGFGIRKVFCYSRTWSTSSLECDLDLEIDSRHYLSSVALNAQDVRAFDDTGAKYDGVLLKTPSTPWVPTFTGSYPSGVDIPITILFATSSISPKPPRLTVLRAPILINNARVEAEVRDLPLIVSLLPARMARWLQENL